MAENPIAYLQSGLRLILLRPADAFADIADILKLTSQNVLLRWFMVALLCLLPFASAVLGLPGDASIRHNIGASVESALGGPEIYPAIPMICSVITLVLVICINRGWARTELLREQLIVKNLDTPNFPPDLRAEALLAAIILVLLVPVLLFYTNVLSCGQSPPSCLFKGASPSAAPWSMAADIAIQTLTFSIPQEVLRYPNFSNFEPIGVDGRAAMIAIRILVQIVFVGCLFELIRIKRTVDIVVKRLKALGDVETSPLSHSEMKLGFRLVPALCASVKTLHDNADTQLHNLANALRQVGGASSIPTLQGIFSNRHLRYWTRKSALIALTTIAEDVRARITESRSYAITLRLVLVQLWLWCRWQLIWETRRSAANGKAGIKNALLQLRNASAS